MKKWLIRIALVTLALVVVTAVVVSIYLDTLAHRATEYGASYALGVKTTIEDMDLKPIAGRLTIDHLNIANPEGFDMPRFLALDYADVTLAIGSLASEHVVIPNITLSGIHVNLEKKNNTANYSVILGNLKKFESDDPTDTPTPDPDKPEQSFTIEKLLLEDIHVVADLTGLGKLTRVPIEIDRIYLTDVRSDQDNTAIAARLTNVIIKALLAGIAKKGDNLLPGDIGNELGKGLTQLNQIAGVTSQLAAQAAKQPGIIKDQIGQGMKKIVEDTAKGIEDIGKDIGKDIGGILNLGKKKKKQSDDHDSKN